MVTNLSHQAMSPGAHVFLPIKVDKSKYSPVAPGQAVVVLAADKSLVPELDKKQGIRSFRVQADFVIVGAVPNRLANVLTDDRD